MRTALNLSIDTHRMHINHGEEVMLDEVILIDAAPTAEAVVLARERVARLSVCLGRLSEKTREITLIEGQVSVRSASKESDNAGEARPVLLSPGDRFRLKEPDGRAAKGAQPLTMQIDRPHVDQLLAWRRNEAVFDDVTLSDAVAEMNRYSRQPIVLAGDSSKALRISGVFRTGDNVAFARAVAALLGLVLHDRQDRVELALGSGG